MTEQPLEVKPPRRCRVVFVAEVATEVRMIGPDDEIPIDPGDTWGVSISLLHSGTRFAMRYQEAQALVEALNRVIADIDEDIKKRCGGE